jgi:hypothetical protein
MRWKTSHLDGGKLQESVEDLEMTSLWWEGLYWVLGKGWPGKSSLGGRHALCFGED